MATVQGVKLKKGNTVVFPITHIDAVKATNGDNLSKYLTDNFYTESEIDSKVSTLNTAINGKANSSHTHDYATLTDKSCTTSNSNQITLTSLNKGEWLSINCRTNPPNDEGSNSSSNRRYIKLPSGGKFVLIVSEQETSSNVPDIKSGIYAGGHIFDNSYWDGDYTRYSQSVYLNGILLRLS